MSKQAAQATNRGHGWERLERICLDPRAAWWLLGLALLLVVPTMSLGLLVDDYFHKFVLAGSPGGIAPTPAPWMHLFSFLAKGSTPTAVHFGGELYPWWTDPNIQVTFWRPLTALTHWLDYQLWPDWPSLMHLHNIAWFLLLCVVAQKLYRSLLPDPEVAAIAMLSACLYVINDAFAFPVAWIANRNGLLAVFFGLLALWCHHRWRTEGWRWGWLAGLLCFGLGLLSAEAGLGASALLFAYAVCLDKGPWWQRGLRLVPYAALAVIWRIAYTKMGYGTVKSGFYVDPIHSPLAFVRSVVEHMPLLLLGQWGFPGPSVYLTLPATAQLVWWLWALLFLGLLGVVLWPLRRDPHVRFGLLGMFFALIPACATKPHERLTLFANFGAMLVLAQLFWLWQGRAPSLPQRKGWQRLARGMVVLMVCVHFVGNPLMLLAKGQGMRWPDHWIQKLSRDLQIKPGATHEPVVLINSISVFFDINVVLRRVMQGKPAPRQLWTLAPARYGVTLKSIDERTLSLRPQRGFLHEFDTLYRDPAQPFRKGEQVKRRGYKVTVISLLPDGRPHEIHVRFDLPWRSSRLHLYQGTAQGYRLFQPPAIGQQVWLPPVRW